MECVDLVVEDGLGEISPDFAFESGTASGVPLPSMITTAKPCSANHWEVA